MEVDDLIRIKNNTARMNQDNEQQSGLKCCNAKN